MATLDRDYPAPAGGLKEKMEEFERAIIQAALAEAGGNQRRAAASLGVLPTTFLPTERVSPTPTSIAYPEVGYLAG